MSILHRCYRPTRGIRPPRAKLLLMPETSPSDAPPSWAWVSLGGQDGLTVQAQGQWSPGAVLAPELQQATTESDVVLLLPPATVTRFELPAPKGLKRDEWPLLTDQYRCDEGNGESLELARLEQAPGRLVLVGVSRTLLYDWQATLTEAGLSPAAWAPAFLGQPEPPDGALCVLPAGPDWMLLWRDTGTTRGPGACHWLAWPRSEPLPPALTEREWHQPLNDEDGRSRLAFLGRHLPSLLPVFRSAKGGPRSGRRLIASLTRLGTPLPRRRLLLAALLAVLHLGLLFWQDQRLTRPDANQHQAAYFIEPPGSEAEASERLALRASTLADLGQRNARAERLLASLEGLPADARLRHLAVQGQQLTLSWSTQALAAPEAEALRTRLAALGPVTDTDADLTLRVDLSSPLLPGTLD